MARLGKAGADVHSVRKAIGTEPVEIPHLPGDPHPTPEVHRAIAEWIVQELLP
jgi:hypothetical protein